MSLTNGQKILTALTENALLGSQGAYLDDTSVTTQRSQYRQNYNKNVYAAGSQMDIIFNLGSQYVYGPRTVLEFDLKVLSSEMTAAPVGKQEKLILSLGNNTPNYMSVLSLFKNVDLVHNSGQNLESERDINILNNRVTAWTASKKHREKFMTSLMGAGGVELKTPNGTVAPNVVTKRFVVPMKYLLKLFGLKKMLIPELLSGAKMSIVLADKTDLNFTNAAGDGPAGATTTYELNDVSIRWDAYTLASSYRAELQKIVATEGIKYNFRSFFHTSVQGASSSYIGDVSKSAGRVFSIIVVPRYADPATDNANKNPHLSLSMATDAPKISFRYGSMSYPSSQTKNSEELYYMATELSPRNADGLTFTEFKTDQGIIYVSLSRSAVVDLAGIPTNSAASVSYEILYNASNVNRKLDIFMEYLTSLDVGLNDVVKSE